MHCAIQCDWLYSLSSWEKRMSMVILNNIPENLRYFLFKKNLSVKEFASQINESHSTLLAIVKGKIARTNSSLCQKIATAIGVDLQSLQMKLLESNPGLFRNPLPIIHRNELGRSLPDCVPIGSYKTLNQSADNSCFVIRTDSKLNCCVVLKPVFSIREVKDGDTLLLLLAKSPILRIIEIRYSGSSTIISTLTGRLQVDDAIMMSEFTRKYRTLGRVIEIRHDWSIFRSQRKDVNCFSHDDGCLYLF